MAGLFLLAGCGKVGNPLPPITQVPPTVDTMDVVQEGGASIRVVFPLPTSTVQDVTILRRCGAPDENELRGILQVKVSDLQQTADGQRYEASDPSPRFDVPCAYAVRFRNRYGRRSAASNVVTTRPGPPPAAPTGLRVEVRPSQIEVFWEPPQDSKGIVGYLVDARDFVTRSPYIIKDFTFGEELSVVVQSVGRRRDPVILSAPSASLSFVPRDTFAPPPPANLTAVSVAGGVQLVWDAVTEADVRGYNVYRSSGTGGKFMKIAGPLPVPRYFDAVEQASGVLYYEVTAVDRSGNESGYSNRAEASSAP